MTLVRPIALLPTAKIGAGTIFWCAVAVLGIVTAVLYGLAPKPPLGIQPDEPKKAAFILGGHQDFKHPILMLNLVRLANLWVGATEPAAVIDLGRVLSSIAGAVTVIAAAAFARRIVGPVAALCAGLLTALAPLTLFHAQIVKEDIYVAPCLLLGLLALDRLREGARMDSAILFGGTLGLAVSAKYIGAILLPLALILPLLVGQVAQPVSRYYRMLGLSTAIALGVFVVINAPLIFAYGTFAEGLAFEIHHSMTGHLLRLPGWYTWFAFYLREGLLPWPQLPFTIAGLIGAGYVILRWRSAVPAAQALVIFVIAWYFIHEISPMKPWVGPARHMTALSGPFAILAVYALSALVERLDGRWRSAAFALVIAAIAVPASVTTIAIARTGDDDTRVMLERLRPGLNGPSVTDQYSAIQLHDRAWAFAVRNMDWTKFRYAIVSDRVMERFLAIDPHRGQHAAVPRFVEGYKVLNELPAVQITSTVGSYSHRNSPVRVILLGDPAAHLKQIMAHAPQATSVELRALPGTASQR